MSAFGIVFGQLYKEISGWDASSLRRSFLGKGNWGQRRAFKVKFVGEGVNDHGGPLRALWEQICEELQLDNAWPDDDSRLESLLPLFLPSPNRFASTGSIGRDKYVLNPGEEALHYFSFWGKLMGMACRHRLTLAIDLPQLVWRPLACLYVSREHLLEVDQTFLNLVQGVEEGRGDADGKMVTSLSSGKVVDLVPGGSAIPINGRHEDFVRRAVSVRLKESQNQLAALSKQEYLTWFPLSYSAFFLPESSKRCFVVTAASTSISFATTQSMKVAFLLTTRISRTFGRFYPSLATRKRQNF